MASHIAAGWFIDATHATDTSENTACIPRRSIGSQGTSGRQRAGRENRAPLSPRCIRRIHPGSGDPSAPEGNMRVRGSGSARWGGVGRRRWASSPPRRRRPYRNSRQPRSRQPRRRGAFPRSRTRAMRRVGGRASAPRSRPPATRPPRQPRSHPRASSIPTARRPGAYRGPPFPRLGSSQKGRSSSRRPRWSPRCAAGARTRARRFFP